MTGMKSTAWAVNRALFGALCLALAPAALLAQEAAHDDHDSAEQLTLETAPVQQEVALSCAFARECYEDEPCQEAGYGITLTGRAGGMAEDALVVESVMSSETGDEMMVGVKAGGYALSGGGFEARHMLTIGAEGAARYTVHYADPVMVISYIGQCLETE